MNWNDVTTAILRSPLHGLMSGSTMLITVTGRKSGRTITTPVNYVWSGKRLLVTSLVKRTWWRNLLGGAPISVLLRGKAIRGTAYARTGPGPVTQPLMALLAEKPAWATRFGIRRQADGSFEAADLRRAAGERVVVEIGLENV